MAASWVSFAAVLVSAAALGRLLWLARWRRRLAARLRSRPSPPAGPAARFPTGTAAPGPSGVQQEPYPPPAWIAPWVPVFGPVGRQLTFNRSQLARWLQLAGSPPGWTLEAVMAFRGLGLIGGMAAGTLVRLLGLGGPLSMVVLALGGYLTPELWLRSLARRRQAELARSVPDLMDLIATCLEANAGLTIPHVLARAEPHLEGPLQEEIRLLNRQVEMGMPRDQAYQALLDRNDCPELAALVETLRRGGELGVPIAETVRAQAEVLRQIRRRKARWAGERADLWVSVITFALSLPSALVFIFALFLLVLATRPEAVGLRLW